MPTTDTNVLRAGVSSERLNDLKDTLRKRAYLYDSPEDYRAGVEAALNAFMRETRKLDLDLDLALADLEAELDLTAS